MLALSTTTLQEKLNWVRNTYPFDAFSHYLMEQPLHPRQHLQTYGRGHCLDLAVALSEQLGSVAQIVGQIQSKSGWTIPTHYAVLASTPTADFWLDPSIGILTPLTVGAEFSFGTKRNRITGVNAQSFDLLIDNTRQITISYQRVPKSELMEHQHLIWHTRKDLSLRFQGEQIRYYWQSQQFTWNEQPFQLQPHRCTNDLYLARTFGFEVLSMLSRFHSIYSRIPDSTWQHQL